MKNNKTQKITIAALAAAINIVGANIALVLKLPIYLDAIGTVFSAALLGPVYGMATGIIATGINQITDPFAIWFMPSNLITAVMAGVIFKKFYKSYKFSPKLFVIAFIVAIPGTIISSITAAYLFGGVTSSGSSIIVQILSKMGVGMVPSVFITQVFTDYFDRLLALSLTLLIIKVLPSSLVRKVKQ